MLDMHAGEEHRYTDCSKSMLLVVYSNVMYNIKGVLFTCSD